MSLGKNLFFILGVRFVLVLVWFCGGFCLDLGVVWGFFGSLLWCLRHDGGRGRFSVSVQEARKELEIFTSWFRSSKSNCDVPR